MAPIPLVLLIDGECPICGREAEFLRRLDRKRGNLRVVDVSSPKFVAAQYGRTVDQLRVRPHAVTPDGEFFAGLEAVHRAYCAVGWGFMSAPTRWPILRPISDWMYSLVTRNRPLLQAIAYSGPAGHRGQRQGPRQSSFGPM